MKKTTIVVLAGLLSVTACRQNPENGGEEIRGNEQRSDTPMNISNYPNEGSYDSSNMNNNPNQPANSNSGTRNFEGTRQDSQKTKANPLYKGDNSDTGKKRK